MINGEGQSLPGGGNWRRAGETPRRASRIVVCLALAWTVSYPASARQYVSPNEQHNGFFGRSVSAVPDADGDHLMDVVVGSVEDVGEPQDAGRAYIFSGCTSSVHRVLKSPNPQALGHFGWAVAGLSDVNGDGRGDVAIGAYGEYPGSSPFMAGRAYIISGATGGAIHELSSPNEQYSGHFGWAVAAVPDVTGDGKPEVIAGAPNEMAADGMEDSGRAYLFDGATGQLLLELASPNAANNGEFGTAVAGLKDVTGDGRGDVAVSANGESSSTLYAHTGMVYVFNGVTGDLVYAFAPPVPTNNGAFGASLADAGVTGNPSFSDILVGAPRENGGRAYVFSGATGQQLFTLQSPAAQTDGLFGCSVTAVADMDADGAVEWLAGASAENTTTRGVGRAYLFDGADGALLATYTSPFEIVDGAFGFAVAGADDLDDDPWGDPIIGAPSEGSSPHPPGSGRAYAYLKNLPATETMIVVPPVADQTAAGFARYAVSDFGPGVCFAVGYYYKTSQEAAERRWTETELTSEGLQRSPFFLYRNGGAKYLHFSFELLKGWGICSMKDFPTTDTETTDGILERAADDKALDYRAFFSRFAQVDGLGVFASEWDNDTETLKSWLSVQRDGFVIGIPVFQSFEGYQQGVYDVDAREEILVGFHALYVKGHDDTKGAFQVVNSWGSGWGEGGYGWLSDAFVRKYALEAWRMTDSRGLSPFRRVVKTGRRQAASTKDYNITYWTKGAGAISLSAAGVEIAGGGNDDTLSIRKKGAAEAGEIIPFVVSDGGMARVYTEAPIGELAAGGRLGRLTARNGGWVGSVSGEDITRVKMSATPNSTWQYLSYYLAENLRNYYDNEGQWLNSQVHTRIADVYAARGLKGETLRGARPASRQKTTRIRLSGVRAADVTTFWNVDLRMSCKKIKKTGVPAYYGQCGLTQDSTIAPDPDAIARIRVTGGAIESQSVSAGRIDLIEAVGMPISMILTSANRYRKQYDDYYAGDIRVGDIYSWDRLGRVTARGGNLLFESLVSAKSIGTVSATYRKYYKERVRKTEYAGGFLGNAASSGTVEVTGEFWGDRPDKAPNIGAVFGALGVTGVFSPDTCEGSVGMIATEEPLKVPPHFYPPRITGEAWSKKKIRILNGDDTDFVEHPCD